MLPGLLACSEMTGGLCELMGKKRKEVVKIMEDLSQAFGLFWNRGYMLQRGPPKGYRTCIRKLPCSGGRDQGRSTYSPIPPYCHNSGGAFCLYLSSRQRNRGSERFSKLLKVTQLVSDRCWIHIKDLQCVSGVQTLNVCLILALVAKAHGRHWRKPKYISFPWIDVSSKIQLVWEYERENRIRAHC